jgi:asparagine synthase (glutamine-hydrolysing)
MAGRDCGASGLPVARLEGRAALCLDDTIPGAGSVYETQDTIAVIEGLPRWKDSVYADIAEQRGHGAALLQAWREHGADLFASLYGAFSLALVDRHQSRALLAIDRMGVRQLHFARGEDGLVFASRAAQVLRHPAIGSRINPQAIYHYLYFHMIPGPATLYQGVRRLMPGERLVLNGNDQQIDNYWRPRFSVSTSPVSTLEEQARHVLADAVRRQGAGAHAAFLSGGLDSSTVSGLLDDSQDGDVHAFSVGFEAEGYDEMEYARTAAAHFSLRHHEYYVTPRDVVEAIPDIAAAYDEPFGNSSVVPTYYCARAAKAAGHDIMLAGDGGDELFAGNTRYAKQKLFELYFRVPGALRGLLQATMFGLPGTAAFPPTRKLRSYIEQALVPLPDRMQSYNYFHREPAQSILHDALLSRIEPGAPLSHLQSIYREAPAEDVLNKMLWLDWRITLADNDLRKVNEMCQLAGVEVRYPMLDDDVVEFSACVPPALKLRRFRLRWFFKHAFRDYLPAKILNKSKHGFGLPFGVWMKTWPPLQDIACGSLNDLKKREYINPEYIDRLIGQHQSEHAAYYGEMIWVLMMLEQWLQTH